MKKFNFQKKIEKLNDSDFLDGLVDSWQIWIQSNEFSLPSHYMQCGFNFEQSAINEVERIMKAYEKRGEELFKIEIRKVKVRRLKNPISVS